MASKPETTFYTGVHKHLDPKLYREKMHNPYRGGTWDFWFSGRRDLWIEYKFVVLPQRAKSKVDVTLSPLQVKWGGDRLAEGRSVAVIVGSKEGGVILLDRTWEKPMTCAEFRSQIKSRAELADWIMKTTGGPP